METGALERWSVVVFPRVGKCPDFLVGATLSSLHGGWSSGTAFAKFLVTGEGASFVPFADLFARRKVLLCW